MAKHWQKTIWAIFWLGWAITAIIFWRANPNMMNYSGLSLHAAAGQAVHGLMLAGIDVFVIWLGSVSNHLHLKLSRLIETWFMMVISGTLAVFLLIFRKQFEISDLYSALFPILRNTVPIVSGLLLGAVGEYFLKRYSLQLNGRTLLILMITLLVPFIFNADMWGFNGGTNPLAYAILFLIGTCRVKTNDQRLVINLLISGIIGLGLIALMPSISMMNHGNLSTAARMTSIVNPFLVLSSYDLVILANRHWRINHLSISDWLATVATLTLVITPAMSRRISSFLIRHTHHSTMKLLLWSPLVALVAIVAAGIITVVFLAISRHFKLDDRLTHYFQALSAHGTFDSWQNFLTYLKSLYHRHLAGAWVVIISYLLALLSMLLMNSSMKFSPNVGGTVNTFMYTFFGRQSLVQLNTIIILAFIMFLWALTRHYYVSVLTTSFLLLAWILANRLKIVARNEPILPSDLKLAGVGSSIMGMVSWWIYLVVIIVLLAMIVLCVRLERHHHQKVPHLASSIASFVILPLLLVSTLGWNHQGSILNSVVQGFGDQPMFYNQLSGARINGPIVQFMNNIDVKVMNQPQNYSKATMLKIRRRYVAAARSINRNRHYRLDQQTIIFNLSESFSNPRRVPGVKLAANPIPYIDHLKKTNTGGLMISSGYGGGTANMEYMTLTGFTLANFSPTLPTPYTQLVVKLAQNPSFVGSFHHATAIHPYLGTFYSRQTVYKKFGFQHFYFLGNKAYPIRHQHKIQRSDYQSDRTSYENVLDQIKRQKSGQFIHLATMQNHYPYDRNFYHHSSRYRISASHGTNKNSLADYVEGIHYTDRAVKRFIHQINSINRPITIVFYGDHLPGSIYGNSMKKDGLKLHETDYFIYSNKYARQHGAIAKLHHDAKVVDPNDFIAMVAAQTNSKVNWYQAMLTDVWQKLPAVALQTNQTSSSTNTYNTSPEFINGSAHRISMKHWNKNQRQLWHDYKLVQYDVTAGHQYLVRDGQLK